MAVERSDWNFETPSKGGDDAPLPVTTEAGEGPALSPDELLAEIRGELDDGDGRYLPAGTGGELEPNLLEEWEQSGGVDHRLAVAQRAAQTILDAVPELEAEFDRLPQGVQTAVFRELALTPKYRSTEQDALDRIDRIETGLSPHELAATETWLKARTPAQKKAILTVLMGKP